MDADQNDICQFLKSWPGQFVSRKEICRRAGGKWRYREDENWALPVLQRMLENYVIESDGAGHFRLMKQLLPGQKEKKKMWISPAIRNILQQSGRDFGVVDLDKELDPAELPESADQALCQQLVD